MLRPLHVAHVVFPRFEVQFVDPESLHCQRVSADTNTLTIFGDCGLKTWFYVCPVSIHIFILMHQEMVQNYVSKTQVPKANGGCIGCVATPETKASAGEKLGPELGP